MVVETRGGVAIIRPHGDLFLRESDVFEERTTELLRANYELFLINLSGINYIGSSGIGALVNLYNQLTKIGGRLILTNLPDKVVEVLQIMGLELIDTMESEREALSELNRSQP
jgi:anti-sigma B factor antagonist